MSDQNETNYAKAAPSYGHNTFVCPYPSCNANSQHRWFYLSAEKAGPTSLFMLPKGLETGDAEYAKDRLIDLEADGTFANSEWNQIVDLMRFSEDGRIEMRPVNGRPMNETITIDRSTGAQLIFGLANLQISQCHSCKEIAVWQRGHIVFPQSFSASPPPLQDMPKDVAEIYNEARSISVQSPRSAAALLRLCLEELLKDQKVEGDKLNDMIRSAVKMGVSEEAQQAMDILRLYGNDSIHQHKGEIDLSEVEGAEHMLFDLINFVVSELISRPNQLNSAFGAMPKNKRDGIAQRDKND